MVQQSQSCRRFRLHRSTDGVFQQYAQPFAQTPDRLLRQDHSVTTPPTPLPQSNHQGIDVIGLDRLVMSDEDEPIDASLCHQHAVEGIAM